MWHEAWTEVLNEIASTVATRWTALRGLDLGRLVFLCLLAGCTPPAEPPVFVPDEPDRPSETQYYQGLPESDAHTLRELHLALDYPDAFHCGPPVALSGSDDARLADDGFYATSTVYPDGREEWVVAIAYPPCEAPTDGRARQLTIVLLSRSAPEAPLRITARRQQDTFGQPSLYWITRGLQGHVLVQDRLSNGATRMHVYRATPDALEGHALSATAPPGRQLLVFVNARRRLEIREVSGNHCAVVERPIRAYPLGPWSTGDLPPSVAMGDDDGDDSDAMPCPAETGRAIETRSGNDEDNARLQAETETPSVPHGTEDGSSEPADVD